MRLSHVMVWDEVHMKAPRYGGGSLNWYNCKHIVECLEWKMAERKGCEKKNSLFVRIQRM